jgi:hypothetical protein
LPFVIGTEQRPTFHVLGKKSVEAMTQEFGCGREFVHFYAPCYLAQLQLHGLKRSLLRLVTNIASRRSDAVRRLLCRF